MYLISPKLKQYKANLHCHSVISDGKKTPEELKEMYKRNGYSVLCITDHEVPNNHSYLTDPDFLMLTGYEAYIRNNFDAKSDAYKDEIHMNLFARRPEITTMIGYEQRYYKYISKEVQDTYKKAGPEGKRKYTAEYINEFIKVAKENGYIVAHNHAYWSMEKEEMLLAYDGFFSMEMCNYSSYLINHLEYNAPLYEKLILSGKKLFCHSADDNHNVHPEGSPRCDSFGGFTMIMADELKYDSIFSAMEKGEMYSSMGPTFSEVSIEGNKIHIECSDVERIMVFTGSKSPKSKFAEIGETINTADFEIDDRAKFVRVSIVDKYGKFADTRAFLREELEF